MVSTTGSDSVGGGSSRNFSVISMTGSDSVEILPINNSIKLSRFRGSFLHFRATYASPAVYGHSRKFRHTVLPGLLTHSNHVTTSIRSGKKHLPKVWGGMAPLAPPGYATGPKHRWVDCFNRDMTAIGTTKDEVHDRTGWRRIESTAGIPQPSFSPAARGGNLVKNTPKPGYW